MIVVDVVKVKGVFMVVLLMSAHEGNNCCDNYALCSAVSVTFNPISLTVAVYLLQDGQKS